MLILASISKSNIKVSRIVCLLNLLFVLLFLVPLLYKILVLEVGLKCLNSLSHDESKFRLFIEGYSNLAGNMSDIQSASLCSLRAQQINCWLHYFHYAVSYYTASVL